MEPWSKSTCCLSVASRGSRAMTSASARFVEVETSTAFAADSLNTATKMASCPLTRWIIRSARSTIFTVATSPSFTERPTGSAARSASDCSSASTRTG